jgi:hypothetical protein
MEGTAATADGDGLDVLGRDVAVDELAAVAARKCGQIPWSVGTARNSNATGRGSTTRGSQRPAVGVCVPLYARAPLDRSSGCLIEDRPEDSIGLPDVLDTPVAGDEREDLFGVFARHRGGLVGPHVRQVTQRDLERD